MSPLVTQRIAQTPRWAKNELWRRARAVPSLDLRFADNKSLVDATTGQNLVTFTRASEATFVNSQGQIQTAANNAPRFDHNPTTGESLGLLVEESRQNLLVQSNGFDTTWTNSNSSETAAAGIAPDGTNTAWELKDTTDGSAVVHSINQAVSFTAGLTYTFSVWAKSGSLSVVGLQIPAAAFGSALASRYSLATGTITSTPAGGTTAIQAFNNGWHRCSLTATATTTASGVVNIRTAVGGNVSYQGDGTGTILIWGAQLEAGAFPTSYIPTTASAATRAADMASIGSGSNYSSWANNSEGTMFVDSKVDFTPGATKYAWSLFGGSVDTSLRQPQTTGSAFRAVIGGTFTSAPGTGGNATDGSVTKAAVAWTANTGRIQVGTSSSDVSPASATDANQMSIGAHNGRIKRLTFWPRRLQNSTLQDITT